MSRWSKRMKKYERHILLGLVILLLVSFSVTGAISCQQQGEGEDLSGSFHVTPSKTATVDTEELLTRFRDYQRLQYAIRMPSLEYGPLLYGAPLLGGLPGAWAHIMPVEAARSAGYRCGQGNQLNIAIRRALEPVTSLNFSEAAYDKFLREYSFASAKDFEASLSEIVLKDLFLRPLVDTGRYGITYEQAYEEWKKFQERVNLAYVALPGDAFGLPALEIETTRSAIQTQEDVLRSVVRTARKLDFLRAQITSWQAQNEDKLPESLADLPRAGSRDAPKDSWENDIRYTREGDDATLVSAGPDGLLDTPDDVTEDASRHLQTRAALLQVGDAARSWRTATDAWPESLATLQERPKEGALPPLTQERKDGWDQPLAYDLGDGDALPTLRSIGPDGVAGTEDDVPAEISVERTLVLPGPGLDFYVDRSLRDVWKRDLRTSIGNAATWAFEVASAGPDGAFDTDDDVVDGNGADLAVFYDEPEVQSEHLLPTRRRFQAIYMHLPLIPDRALRALWDAHPDLRADMAALENAAFNRWRQYHPAPYYAAENPADPESGHGAELAARLAPDTTPTLVPDRSIFGDPPADLIPADNPDREAYLDGGWREILLREQFLERVMNQWLQGARQSRVAVAAWEEKKKAFDETGEGENPGERPAEVSFSSLLAETLTPYLPVEGEPPFLGFFETEKPLERTEWESDPHVGGDMNLTITGLNQIPEDGHYAPIPTLLHNSHTKALLRGIELLPQRQPKLSEVRDEVFERFVEERRLELAADALEDLREAFANRGAAAAETEPGEEPAADDAASKAWAETVEAWKTRHDLGTHVFEGETGLFIGVRPPKSPTLPDAMPEDEKAGIRRTDFARLSGYSTVRPEPVGDQFAATPVGTVGREVLEDKTSDGTDCAYLVRVIEQEYPPPGALSPREYSYYLTREILGDALLRNPPRRKPGEPPRGILPGALHHFFADFPWIRSTFGLDTATKLDAEAGR